jgi:hypothetical protein
MLRHIPVAISAAVLRCVKGPNWGGEGVNLTDLITYLSSKDREVEQL